MSWKKHMGVVTPALLLGAVPMVNGCTTTTVIMVEADGGSESGVIVVNKEAGSTTPSSGDDSGGSDSGSSDSGGSGSSDSGGSGSSEGGVIVVHTEAGTSSTSGHDSGGDGSGGLAFDGTTGKACMSDADCVSTNPDAPGLVRCSLTLFTDGAIFPTGVCLIPPVQNGNCSTPNDGLIHFCDGPDAPSSPGLCVPLSGGSVVGNCYPQCIFASDATAAIGCVGKDACSAVGFGPDANNPTAAIGVGFCFGGCQVDSDCPSGNLCQSNLGLCLTTLTAQDPEGQACMQPVTGDACDCLSNSTAGFCGLSCVTAGSVSCPAGQVCDAFLPTEIPTAGSVALTGWSAQNPGMAGLCLPKCALEGGAQTEAGTCYPTSTCVDDTVVGPDCEP